MSSSNAGDVTSSSKPPAIIVAGTHSGVGKTTVTLTLLRAFVSAGYSVRPFKHGPDFIDTAYHGEVAGRNSINLDLWMMGTENVKRAFERYSADADIAVIESMGALFDGEDGTERGSAAYLSKLLDVPVVLVIDIWGMTRSAVPLLQGFLSFDKALKFAGFIMNQAGSARHADMVYAALPPELRKLCLGHVLHRDALHIPERHLGLVTLEENQVEAGVRRVALDNARSGLNLSAILPRKEPSDRLQRAETPAGIRRTRIAIAQDGAFCFYYAENLSLLEQAGAELCPFSPIADVSLPPDIAGVYIGGGYPESFLDALCSNVAMREALRESAAREMPIYAECGGFMYLGQTLTGADRQSASMTGIFPIDTIMDPDHLAIRYVTVRTIVDSPLGPTGIEARGQEFHQSRIVGSPSGKPIYEVTSTTGQQSFEGMLAGAAVGSYIHLHFSSNRELPRHFVESCAAWARGSGK
jgi:cobyrinic acid a,c-diamide synthase